MGNHSLVWNKLRIINKRYTGASCMHDCFYEKRRRPCSNNSSKLLDATSSSCNLPLSASCCCILLLAAARTCQPTCQQQRCSLGIPRASFGSLSVGGLSGRKIDIARMSADPVSGLPVCPAAEPAGVHWYATRWCANGLRSVALVCRQASYGSMGLIYLYPRLRSTCLDQRR